MDAVGELTGFHNRYSYAGGNPVNQVDRSGMCWDHPMTTETQRNQCLSAWVDYAGNIDLNNEETRQLLQQEDTYWGGLSYSQFVTLWNDNDTRPPSRTNTGGEWQQASAVAVGAAAATGPTPDDIIWLVGALCLYGMSLSARAGAIALPLRQPYYFSESSDRASEEDDAIPIPEDFPQTCSNTYPDIPSCAQLP